MKTKLFITALVLFSFSFLSQAQKKNKDIPGDARKAIAEMKKKDPGISKFFNSAYAYAVFPNMGKGGLMYEASVGGQKFKVEKY